MDIAAMSIVLSQSKVKQQASYSVMKTILSSAESNADGLIEMLNKSNGNNASHPYLGTNIDIKG